MRIVNAEPDGYPDEAREILRSLGELVELAGSRDSLLESVGDADILVVRLANQIDKEVFSRARRLKVLVSATTGLNHIDLEEAGRRQVTVLCLKGERAFLETVTATAEHTWGLLLALVRHLVPANEAVRAGQWDRDLHRGMQLSGKTLGIVGYGRLGHMLAEYARAFRMQVLYADPHVAPRPDDPTRVTLPDLLACCDVVSLLVAYSRENHHMIGARELALMKRDAVLINTARGELVDEVALLAALKAGKIAGAALDVVENEAGQPAEWWASHPLIAYARESSRLLLTPHIGGATKDSMRNAEIYMAKKLRACFEITHQND